MIISVYGIPRSGKDTFISKVIAKKNNYFHLMGSDTLNELSFRLFDCKFRLLDENKQKTIRIEFTKYAKELENKYDFVVVDGHYSFPKDNGYDVVFTKEDLELYDAFFYLKRTGEEIIQNYNNSDKKDYSNDLLSIDKSETWMEFEIQNMKREVESIEKDFIVLDSDPSSIDYVCNYEKTSKKIASDIANSIISFSKGRKMVLSDLDKTVSINDLTNDFIEHSGLDLNYSKEIFKGDYYTSYQFSRFHNFLLTSPNYEESIQYALRMLCLNDYIVSDLMKLKESCCLVALSTGIVGAWNIINEKNNLFDRIYGTCLDDGIVITPLIKKLVAKYLSQSSSVLAIGDSIIDLGMILESKKGYIVSMNKLDKRIIRVHESGEINKIIFQPIFSTFKYDFVEEEKIEW